MLTFGGFDFRRIASILAGAASIAGGSASAADMTNLEIMLFQDYALYDERCRGGSGGEMGTFEACGARNYVMFILGQLNWCYGRAGQTGYQMKWHRCGTASNIPMKP